MKVFAPLALVAALLLVPSSAESAPQPECLGKPATLLGTPAQPLVGTPGDDVVLAEGASTVDTLGGNDLVCLTEVINGGQTVVNAGPGNDRVLVYELYLRYVTSVDGGDGRDRVIVQADRETSGKRYVNVDLAHDEVVFTDDEPAYTFDVPGFEDASVLGIPRAHVYGDDGENRLLVLSTSNAEGLRNNSCRIIVTGRGGDDLLKVLGAPEGKCPEPRISGNQGDDLLIGSPADDLIFGGPGRDTGRGGQGRDLCRVEVATGCEGRPS